MIVALASLLYHERIAAREERFLEEQFGDEFRRWADDVPAMVPAFGRYVPAISVLVARVLGREFHALLSSGRASSSSTWRAGSLATGRLSFDLFWTAVCVGTAVVFLVLMLIKRTTNLLRTW